MPRHARVLRAHATNRAGHGEQVLQKKLAGSQPNLEDAEQLFERAQHLADPSLFGPRAPKTTAASVTEATLHALWFSGSSRVPGFDGLLDYIGFEDSSSSGSDGGGDGAKQQEGGAGGASNPDRRSPIMRLLARVAARYAYHVLCDPLEQLLALTQDCELLFQLLTPHQQLTCMADIVAGLSCPALAHTLWVPGAGVDTWLARLLLK